MKDRLPVAAALLVLFVALCISALGGGSLLSQRSDTGPQAPDILVNGKSISANAHTVLMGETAYFSPQSLLGVLFPECAVTEEPGIFRAELGDITLLAKAGEYFFTLNGHYLYVPETVIEAETGILLPVRVLSESLGCTVSWLEEKFAISIEQTGDPLPPAEYDSDDVYWMSQIIFAESGNQPMAGRIAVGTVILNRVASDLFPDTVYDVIFQQGQFSPVIHGTIYDEPDEESRIAAYLCLEGAKEAEGCLFFNVNDMNSWASKNRTYACTIGDHSFFY